MGKKNDTGNKVQGNKVQGYEVQDRVANYRARAGRNGLQRVETSVLKEDVRLIKDLAGILRQDGNTAALLRSAIRELVPGTQLKTGAEIFEFIKDSPLAGDAEFTIERDKSSGRSIDFET